MSIILTDNQRALMEGAARREDRCFVLPSNLKGGAAQKVAAKLIAEGFAKEIKAKAEAPVWRRDGESDQVYSLKLSAAGARAIGAGEQQKGTLDDPKALASASPSDSVDSADSSRRSPEGGKAAPRDGSKLASVMALLRRSEGATILALTEATGWLPHTTRAAITGVRKRGYSVVLDRSVEGASVYRLANAQESEAATIVRQTQERKPSRRRAGAKAKVNAAA